jgi:hypothetical protein
MASAATPSADVVRGLSATVQADMLADLSPPARVLVTALDTGVGIAAGLGKPLSSAAESAVADMVTSLPDDMASTVAEVASDVAAFIPVFGPILKGLMTVVSALVSAFKGPDSGAECQSLFSVYAPKGTGSIDMGTVPADLFALKHSVGLWYTDGRGASAEDDARAVILDERLAHAGSIHFSGTLPGNPQKMVPWLSGGEWVRPTVPFGPSRCRSALGMALMQITEGCIYDVRDIEHAFVEAEAHPPTAGEKALAMSSDGGGMYIESGLTHLGQLQLLADTDAERRRIATPAAVRALWGKALDRDNRLAPKQWAHAHPDDKPRGLPARWVARFRRLRRAIEASGYGSDGGVALWLAYQDLLVSAFDRGYLSDEYVEFLFARQGAAANKTWGAHPSWFSADQLFGRNPDQQIVESDNITAAPPTWIWFGDPCPHMVTKMVLGLVDRWRRTIHPEYAQGQAKLRALGIQDGDSQWHAEFVGKRRALAKSPGAKAALDAERMRAEQATDAQRLAALPPAPVRVPWWAWVLGALGIGALAGGAVWASRQSGPAPQLPKDFDWKAGER